MSFTVLAGQGLDVARLGEHRDALRARLGPFDVVPRSRDHPSDDYFEGLGLRLAYNASLHLELIMMGRLVDARFEGVYLLGRGWRDVVTDLAALGFVATYIDTPIEQSIEYRDQGFRLFSYDPDDDEDEPEGLAVYTPGHLD
ncbi:hypothetical protein IU483_11845 [Streptomyces gardneri]|nr:hypothetical protein [Streptomyces gardneri]